MSRYGQPQAILLASNRRCDTTTSRPPGQPYPKLHQNNRRKEKAMTSDAPESPRKGSDTDSTSSSPSSAGGTGKAWVAGEPGSADSNSDKFKQDAESPPIVEIRYPKDMEDDARAY